MTQERIKEEVTRATREQVIKKGWRGKDEQEGVTQKKSEKRGFVKMSVRKLRK